MTGKRRQRANGQMGPRAEATARGTAARYCELFAIEQSFSAVSYFLSTRLYLCEKMINWYNLAIGTLIKLQGG